MVQSDLREPKGKKRNYRLLAEDDVDPGRYEDRKLPADATDAGYNRAIHDAVDFGAARSRMLISDVSVR